MTKVTPVENGECIQVIVKDEEDEIRVHYHRGSVRVLRGLLVKNAKLGVIVELGNVTKECG